MENYWNKLVKGCVLLKSRRYSQQAWEKLPREKLFWALFISGFQVRQRLTSVFLNWHVKPTLYDAFIHQPRRQNHRIFRILNDLESFLWHLLTDCPFLLPTHPGHRDKGCNLHTWHFQWLGPHCFWRHPIPSCIVHLFLICYGKWPPGSSFCLLKQHKMNQFSYYYYSYYYWSQLLYNILLVSPVHQSESVALTPSSFLDFLSIWVSAELWVEFPVLYTVGSH